MMSMLSLIAKVYFRSFQKEIERWQTSPLEKQNQLLSEIVSQTRGTLIGNTYSTHAIRDYTTFQRHIPTSTYEAFKPFILKALAYEPNILLRGRVTWFAKSSGTTGDESKFIPTSNAFLQRGHYLAAKHLVSLYLNTFPKTSIFEGKQIIMGGSHCVSRQNKHISTGDLSAILLVNANFIRSLYVTPPLAIATMENWEEKIKAIERASIHQSITSISGVPTWTIAFIKYLLDKYQKNNLAEIWGNFDLYINGGVAYKPYVETMKSLIGKPFHALEVYNASEGFFAAQHSPEDTEGLWLYTNHGVFYEFMEVENPKNIVPLEGVELGKNYALVISNLSGLYRYIIGDTVQFTSIQPYKIRITGRLKQFINAVGEEVIVDNSDEAIAEVAKQMNLPVKDYTAAPSFPTPTQKAYHEWIIATYKPLLDEEKTQFSLLLDDQLQKRNSDYRAKREHNIGLLPPKIHFVDELFFDKWLAKKGKLGGQHKVPRLENSRKYIEDML